MSTVTQQITHVRRAIAYAIWKAEADGRPLEDLFVDEKWLNEVTGKFLAIEIENGTVPATQITISAPASQSNYARQMVEESTS